MSATAPPIHEGRVLVFSGAAIGMLSAQLLGHMGVDRLDVGDVNPLRRRARDFSPSSPRCR
ncbi:MAG: hypothetical protein IPL57_22780 [Rubrivivax sp.]|nr:hypothetical protein [Rubrivivax sp.]